jgi:ABC-2 type transport system permease protein
MNRGSVAMSEEGLNNGGVSKVGVILRKEWMELRQERGLLIGTILPPLFLTILPVLLAWAVGVIPHKPSSMIVQAPNLGPGIQVGGPGTAQPIVTPATGLQGLDTQAVEQAVIGSQFSILFMLLPIVVPAVIASYSIVGEKTGRTLEPLLATPVDVSELLMGKILTAFIPALVITWAGAAAFFLGMVLVSLSPRVVEYIFTLPWLLACLLCAPLMSLIAIGLTVAVSSRVRDPRTAQQIATVLIFPIMGVLLARLVGALTLSFVFVFSAALVLAAIASVVILVAIRLFKRGIILTRWS